MVVLAAPQGQGTLTKLGSPAEVPLRGPRVDAKKGDFMISHQGMVAVISSEDGNVVDFGPEGALDELVSITPSVFDGLGSPRAPVVFVGPVEGNPGVVHIVRRGSALPVELHTFVTFRGPLLVIDSAARPERPGDTLAIGVGERVSWGNVPSWVEGAGLLRREGGTFPARFIGRDGPNLSYALALDGGPTMVRFGAAYLSGYFASGRASELVVADPQRGSLRRTLFLAASKSSVGDAAAALLPPEALRTFDAPKRLPPGGLVEVGWCPEKKELVPNAIEKERTKAKARAELRKPFARFAAGEPLRVPEGCFEARARAPGHTTTDWVELAKAGSLEIAPSGLLVVAITEDGKPSPGRVQVRGVGNTPAPDWGDDPDDGSALSSAQARLGIVRRPVPPGRYRVITDRGFEHSISDETIEVVAGQPTYVSASLSRVVDTRGWISADLHLHAGPSPDAPQSLEDRVVSLAAAGVEVGVASDHNVVTDYRPAIQRLGLESYVASIVGDEVTTEEMGFGHFNVFPLMPGSEPIAYRRTTPSAIFDASRQRAPLFDKTVIQVNHPRMGDIGYFDVMRMDREQLPYLTQRSPWARLDFDAIEVWNGDDAVSLGAVESVIADWTALLDQGLRITATGNSDSHRLSFHEPGLPRNFVAVPNDEPAAFDQKVFIDSLRQGKVIVSGGPFIRFEVEGRGPGERVASGSRKATVEVDAPPWMKVTYIELLQKGQVVARAEGPFPAGPHAAELSTQVELRPGDWILAVAGGDKEIDALFRRGVVPYAFTNPVFVSP